MLDMKFVRDHLDEVQAMLERRHNPMKLDDFQELEKRRREILGEVEGLKGKRNAASKEISVMKKNGENADALVAEMRAVGDKIAALDASHEIERIYVVHKQIDDTHAVTPVVMRFRLETTLEREEELLHQLFLYLDSVDSWDFSIFNADDVPDVPLDQIPGSVFYPPVPR